MSTDCLFNRLNNVGILYNIFMYTDIIKINKIWVLHLSNIPPTGLSSRLPVLRVLVVRITRALVLQVGVMVTGRGGGVGLTAVLVDLIQAPDKNQRGGTLVCCLDAIQILVHGFVLFVVQSGKTWFSFSLFDIFNKKKIDVHLKKGNDKEDEGVTEK